MTAARRPLIGIGCDYEDQVKKPCSFVYVQSVRAVERAGGVPLLVPAIEDLTLIPEILARIQGLMLTGSDDIDPAVYGEPKHPRCDATVPPVKTTPDLAMVRQARAAGIPILAVSGGMQLVNVAFGGTLVQDIPSEFPAALPHGRGARHDVEVAPGTLLAEVFGPGRHYVNSGHHQCTRKLGEGFRLNAAAPDGVPEGFEGEPGTFVLGIGWHPEYLIDDPATLNLFKALIDAARKRGG